MEFLYKFCFGLTTLSGIGLGLFVLYKNPRSRVNVTWALLSLAIAIWSIEVALTLFEPNYEKALLACRISQYAAVFIPVLFTHFCLALLNKPLLESRVAIFGYVFAIGMSGFFLTPWFVPKVSPKLIFLYYVNPGPLHVAFTIQFFALVFYSHWLLFRELHLQSGERQNQIKWVASATIIGYACGSTTFLLAYNVPLNPLPSLFTPVYAMIITYAIVRHHLMDIRIVIKRSVVYSLLIACITATYLVIVLMMEKWFQGVFGYRSIFATVVVAFLIAIFFNPLRTRIQAFVDRALFRATPAELASQRDQLLVEVRKGEQMKAVATLAAGLAHEIKNPLASIKTFTDYLERRYDDPGFREKFHKIVGGEVERINLIVQQLLEFAKPVPPKLAPVEVSKLLDDTLEFLNGELIQRHVEVSRRYEAKPCVLADPQQLKQVFLNLFLNSLQAMDGAPSGHNRTERNPERVPRLRFAPLGASPEPVEGQALSVSRDESKDGAGRLEIHTEVRGAELAVTIADNGSGIPPKDLPHVFEPFYTTKPTGTGLGLAVVHGIVKEHGGRIAVESHPGQGTRITLTLPIAA